MEITDLPKKYQEQAKAKLELSCPKNPDLGRKKIQSGTTYQSANKNRCAVKKRGKYGNKKVEVKGILFDSKKEARVYGELRNRFMAGDIDDLQLQVPFELQPGYRNKAGKKIRDIKYIADFTYKDREGRTHVVDAKGWRTDVYRLKKKLFEYKYPDMELEEV
jgi:hypothetical protein